MNTLNIDFFSYLELEKLGLGIFNPLQGFMDERDFYSVAENMRLANNSFFPLPVVLPISEKNIVSCRNSSELLLLYNNVEVGSIFPNSVYKPNFDKILFPIFGTNDKNHPGFKMFKNTGEYFLGGKIILKQRIKNHLSKYEMTPEEVKAEISKRGMKTVAGFQTRNIPHKAYEYIQRLALEKVDGLFIQPLIGRKKIGDFTPEAIMTSYNKLINNYLPKEKIILGALTTSMRYAGPREALFHSIIRKNYGCTHFIVGRDHAGVSGYYNNYDAQELCTKLESDLKVKILNMRGPFYCNKCDGVVTDNICSHYKEEKNPTFEISGTKIRLMLSGNLKISKKYIRPEIVRCLEGMKVFIRDEN